MTTNTGGIIGSTITGDGNIAGNSNIVQIDKSRHMNHYGNSRGDGRGDRGGRGVGEARPFMAGAVALSLAIVNAAFVFARAAILRCRLFDRAIPSQRFSVRGRRRYF